MNRMSGPCTVGLAVLLSVSSASAQSFRPERPYRGLFGSGTGEGAHVVSANAMLGAGYDDDVLRQNSVVGGIPIGVSGPRQAGVLATGSAALSYRWNADPVRVGASIGSTARYYPTVNDDSLIVASHAQVNADGNLWQRIRFGARVGVSQRPYLFEALVPQPVPQPDAQLTDVAAPDLSLSAAQDTRTYTSFEGNLGSTHNFTARTSLSVNYSYRTAQVRGDEERFSRQTAGVTLAYNIARGVRAVAGYNYRQAQYPTGETAHIHGFNVGIDMNRALSLSRRTLLTFSTGATAAGREEQVRYRFVGQARLTHEIGRTWATWAGYSRDTYFDETFSEPVFADSISVGFGGLFSRRLQFTSLATAARGTRRSHDSSVFYNYRAGASLSMALNRFMNGGLMYSYYYHRLGEDVTLTSATPRVFGRQSVMAVVSVWAPILQAGRRD